MSDKATVVSVYFRDLDERKPGMFPGHFLVKAAPVNGISVLTVGQSFYWVTFAERERESLKVYTPALEIANAIVNDFVRNVPGYNMATGASPGLFVLPNEVSVKEVNSLHADKVLDAKNRQVKWMKSLVSDADDIWTKFRQHRLISSLQRDAADRLGVEREWISEKITEAGPKFCDACRTRVHQEAVICPACSYVLNAEKYAKMTFAGKPTAVK